MPSQSVCASSGLLYQHFVKNDVKFYSFNIGGLVKKLEDSELLNFIDKFDVINLQETFMSSNNIPTSSLSSFLPPFFSPAFRLSSHGRCSGGVIVLVKSYLKDYISEVQTDCPNCIILKFCNVLKKDVICIFPYVTCSDSPFYKNLDTKNGITILERYLSDIFYKNSNCSFIVLGDLNSRTSNVQPIYEENTASRYTDEVNSTVVFV